MVKYLPDYYKILKISTNANKKDIKNAYKKISTQKNKKSDIHTKIIEDAFTVLSNDKKRKKYDKIRKSAIQHKTKKQKQKNNKIKDSVELAKEVKDKYDLISKIFQTGTKAMKIKPLLTGTNIIVGGAMAAYGIKKGREYMAKRGKKNE